jgi:glyoxylase I family protein
MTSTTEAPATTRNAPALTGLQHLGLTVRDVVASEEWYTKVLGLLRAFEEPHGAGDGYAVVMTRPGTGLFVGLDHHPDADREPFSPLRTGVDHEALFESAEPVPHALVVLRDPDGIPIELFWFGG